MGGKDHPASAHILLGRCGITHITVPTDLIAWRATWWNGKSAGDYIDWKKLIDYAGLTEADCFNPPASLSESWQNASGGGAVDGGVKPAGGDAKPAGGGGADAKPSGGGGGGGEVKPAPGGGGKPAAPVGAETLPAPVMVDNHTLRVHVGHRGGRICFSVKQPGDPMPTTPDPSAALEAKAPVKR